MGIKMSKCICEGNWRTIINETQHLFDKKFKSDRKNDNNIYVFYGVVWGSDDFYYGMYSETGKSKLLSCVGNLDGHGFTEIE
jgi:hypothetical protein